MRIATYNLESFGDDTFDPDALAPRLAALRPRLVALGADVLCLQEINAQKARSSEPRDFSALDALVAGTPYEAFYRAASRRADDSGPADRHNLVVLSRYPLASACSLWQQRVTPPLWQPSHALPPEIEPLAVASDRPLLAVRLTLPDGASLHVLCLHLRAPIAAPIAGGKLSATSWRSVDCWAEGYFLATVKQAAQALEARLWVNAVLRKDPGALVAVAGDFNADLSAASLRLLAGKVEDTGNPALAAYCLTALDEVLPETMRGTILHNGRSQALDHILVSAALRRKALSVRVYNEALADEALTPGGTAASFHAAVAADFAL